MSDITEKLDYKFDIEALRDYLINHVLKLGDPVIQGHMFGYDCWGGWAVLNRTGNWDDEWPVGNTACIAADGTVDWKFARFLNSYHFIEQNVPTAACTGPIADIVETLIKDGFYPCNARIAVLKAHTQSIVHSDGSGYIARIHVPIITNEKCIHRIEHDKIHLPADGSAYMLWVDNLHQIINDSDEDRYHLILDAYDTKHLTKKFHYNENIQDRIDRAKEYRAGINAAPELTAEENELYRSKLQKLADDVRKQQDNYAKNWKKL